MAKLNHTNLFAYGDHKEVYEILQRDFNRDTWIQAIWLALFGAATFGAVYVAHRPDWIWLFAGLFALERAIAKYIDNSNRNWAMHVMDWIEEDRSRCAGQGSGDFE